jgi:hypothetical protein
MRVTWHCLDECADRCWSNVQPACSSSLRDFRLKCIAQIYLFMSGHKNVLWL